MLKITYGSIILWCYIRFQHIKTGIICFRINVTGQVVYNINVQFWKYFLDKIKHRAKLDGTK